MFNIPLPLGLSTKSLNWSTTGFVQFDRANAVFFPVTIIETYCHMPRIYTDLKIFLFEYLFIWIKIYVHNKRINLFVLFFNLRLCIQLFNNLKFYVGQIKKLDMWGSKNLSRSLFYKSKIFLLQQYNIIIFVCKYIWYSGARSIFLSIHITII